MELKNFKKILISSHDAGGAEVLSSLLSQMGIEGDFILEGPAVGVYKRKLEINDKRMVKSISADYDLLLTSTSWKSDLEYNLISKAKRLDIRTISLLDHWCNYSERFTRNSIENLPDEIWVSDAMAEELALKSFPGQAIRRVENFFFKDLKNELNGIVSSKNPVPKVLYVCEPLSEFAELRFGNKDHWGYTEHKALRFFLENFEKVIPQKCEIVIRKHPSEAPDKYQWAKDEFKELNISFGGGRSLISEIMECDNIVGCESMALVVGLLAGKRVISSIPPGGRECVLPHNNIEKLSKIVS